MAKESKLKLRTIQKEESKEWFLTQTAMVGLSPGSDFMNYLMFLVQSEISWAFKFKPSEPGSAESVVER